MSLIRKHGAVLQAWACLTLVSWAVVPNTARESCCAALTQRCR